MSDGYFKELKGSNKGATSEALEARSKPRIWLRKVHQLVDHFTSVATRYHLTAFLSRATMATMGEG